MSGEFEIIKKSEDQKIVDYEDILSRAKASEESGKFIISANHYLTLFSKCFDKVSSSADNCEKLSRSFIFSTILLPTGSQKKEIINFILTNAKINSQLYRNILEKLYELYIIDAYEINEILSFCPTVIVNIDREQKLFENMVHEHNIFSLRTVYENVSFETLEHFMKISIDRLIMDKKLKATIDDVNGNLIFTPEFEKYSEFDKQIENFCKKVALLNEYIKGKN